MTRHKFEGGPLDGQWIETDGRHIVRVPRTVPLAVEAFMDPSSPSFAVWEYRREGSIYRFEDMIGDAGAEMRIVAEAFRVAQVRGLVRRHLRRAVQELAPAKQLGSVVWAVSFQPEVAMFQVAMFVGGRRHEQARFWRHANRDLKERE